MNVERFAYFGIVENSFIRGDEATKPVKLAGRVAIQISQAYSRENFGDMVFYVERATIDPNSEEVLNPLNLVEKTFVIPGNGASEPEYIEAVGHLPDHASSWVDGAMRSQIDGANWVRVAPIIVPRDTGHKVQFYEEPAAAWWRVRSYQLHKDFPAIVSISGGGA